MAKERHNHLGTSEEVREKWHFYVQGGPSASGKKYVDIKFKVLSVAWVRGKLTAKCNFKFGVNIFIS